MVPDGPDIVDHGGGRGVSNESGRDQVSLADRGASGVVHQRPYDGRHNRRGNAVPDHLNPIAAGSVAEDMLPWKSHRLAQLLDLSILSRGSLPCHVTSPKRSRVVSVLRGRSSDCQPPAPSEPY